MINRQGATRIVIKLPNYVVKVPNLMDGWKLFLCGLLANLQERQFSKTKWEELCPIVWSSWGGWIVVMERTQVMTSFEFESFDYDDFIRLPAGKVIPVERKWNSFGHLRGKIVAIDYGS